ncbi:MAG: TIGR03936 family radical SAM-associated protein [Candidatus Omnitrophota bacterium]
MHPKRERGSLTGYSFRLRKFGNMIYISHLDLMRALSRAARRADLPVALTQGFSPHHKIKLTRALKLGVPSDNEEGELVLSEPCGETLLQARWQAQLPDGLEIKDVKELT